MTTDFVPPLEELNVQVGGFVDQSEYPTLFLTCFDEEVPTLARALDGLDGASPSDVFLLHFGNVSSTSHYVDSVLQNVIEQMQETNAERIDAGLPTLSILPQLCFRRDVDPLDRLRALLAHMTTWLDPAGDHRLVVALVPEKILDQAAYAAIAGVFIPGATIAPWLRRTRAILRDDRRTPYLVDALRKAQIRGPYLYTTRLTVSDFADAAAAEAANTDLAPARRMNALLQAAALDVALELFEAAIEKYGVLFTYYETHGVTELKAAVLIGLGDVMGRVGRLPDARGRYLQALDLAADAKSLPMIMQASSAIGDVDMRGGAYPEANRSYTLAAATAEKLGNVFVHADMLERAGEARWSSGDVTSAVDGFNASAHSARESGYDARLSTVLERLHGIAATAGYGDLARTYATELAAVRGRITAGGAA